MKNAQVNAWAFFILKLISKMFYSEKYENMSNNNNNNKNICMSCIAHGVWEINNQSRELKIPCYSCMVSMNWKYKGRPCNGAYFRKELSEEYLMTHAIDLIANGLIVRDKTCKTLYPPCISSKIINTVNRTKKRSIDDLLTGTHECCDVN